MLTICLHIWLHVQESLRGPALTGDVARLQRLLASGANVNSVDEVCNSLNQQHTSILTHSLILVVWCQPVAKTDTYP